MDLRKLVACPLDGQIQVLSDEDNEMFLQNKKTPWSESASELYRPSNRRLSTFADRGSHVVSVTDSYGRILGFLDKSR
jgi:hypothetical protein